MHSGEGAALVGADMAAFEAMLSAKDVRVHARPRVGRALVRPL
jgi:hypothetical protein